MPPSTTSLYSLDNGDPVVSFAPYASPREEYRAAFEDVAEPFLTYYMVDDRRIETQSWTREAFWDLASSAAGFLRDMGIGKGDRVLHGFSCNSPYDLAFRLAGVRIGYVPVTINWQVDTLERVLYKANVCRAKALVHDQGFAERFGDIWNALPDIQILRVERINADAGKQQGTPIPLTWEDERIIIFTSGTTGNPKGTSLPHRSYLANRLTYDRYFRLTDEIPLDLLLVNPLHHTNSTALSDWGLRRRHAQIHLVQRYSTLFWRILEDVCALKRERLVTSLVARHFDFLENLVTEQKLSVELSRLQEALSQTDIFIGSAPVGPTTIERIQRFAGRLPHVRFGSTETCLQVAAIPFNMPDDAAMQAFRAGWEHRFEEEAATGYYIGRGHPPFTRLKVIRSIEPTDEDYMEPCAIGEPGYLVTQGGNIMNGYVGDASATEMALSSGWYTGLRDIVFTLQNEDGALDYYWMSRESELLIRGGANYAYGQIERELTQIVQTQLGLAPEEFQLAVVGLRIDSEHEDSCCVTIELSGERVEPSFESQFMAVTRIHCTKAAKPDFVRVAPIPRNFKGAVLYPQLRQEFAEWVRTQQANALIC